MSLRPPFHRSAVIALLVATAAGCTSAAETTDPTPLASSAGNEPAVTDRLDPVVAGIAFPDGRCEANAAAGTITFLTGYDFAAASSIVDVLVADDAGYYEDLCLDVEVRAGFSSDNFAMVASGDAQFASAGSFSEMVAHQTDDAAGDGADGDSDGDSNLVAATVEGRTAMDTLIVKSGQVKRITDLEGSTIGVKDSLPPSLAVMLRDAGLVAGADYRVVELDGFDPVTQLARADVDAVAGWRSNEVGTLDRAGVGVQRFDPLDFAVPGSFGVIYTSEDFVDDHPSAAQDFVRATLLGLADAVADPAAAASTAVDLISARSNPQSLSTETESFRWETEAALILRGTPEGVGLGIPDLDALQAELDAAGSVGLFADADPPVAADHVASDLAAGVYSSPNAVLAWPG